MEKFLEQVFNYGINLALDEIHQGLQAELNQKKDIVAEIVSLYVEKGYVFLKKEINTP